MLVLIILQSGVIYQKPACLALITWYFHKTQSFNLMITYFVTLKTRRRRSALSAERPKEPALSLILTQTTSTMEPMMTMQSNLLKEEVK